MTDTIDLKTPQARIAQDFMARKGYKRIKPSAVEKLDDQSCWYFYYELPEGHLELEVSYAGGEWNTLVTLFTLAS